MLDAAYNAELKVLEQRLESKPEAVQAILEEVAQIDPRAKKVKPQDLIDYRYLDEMDKDGFFDQLWGGERSRQRGSPRKALCRQGKGVGEMTTTKLRRELFWVFTLSLILLLEVPVLNAQSVPKKVTSGLSTLGGTSAIVYLTQKVGFFERRGLDVQVVYFGSGAIAASGLLSGEAKITVMSGNSTLAAALGGAEVVQIGGLTNKLAYGLMVLPSIRSVKDLKGDSIGIAGFGGASDFAANYIIRKEGLVPGKDVLILSVGGQPERLSALVAGKVKAVLLEPPFTGRAEKMGFRRLVNFPSLDLEFQTLGFVTTRSYLKADREACLNFLKAITEGIYFFKSHKKESMTLLASILKTQDQEALEEAYSLNARDIIPDVPYSSLKGLQNTLELLALRNPKARDKDPRETIDDSLVKEMEESGFIAHLRKTYPISAR